MTRNFIFITIFSGLIFATQQVGFAKGNKRNEQMITVKPISTNAIQNGVSNSSQAVNHEPATKSKIPGEGHHSKAPKIDETPHIHRFHKERVKKVSKHHTKLWYLSKMLIVICQISLLVIGFMHMMH